MRMDNYFRGLSDLTRLRIINLLLHEELCGSDIQWVLRITQPFASRHLIYLKRSGLVADRREGFRVFYHLAEGCALRSLFAFLQRAFREEKTFEPDLARLRILLKQGQLTRHHKQRAASGSAEAFAAPLPRRKRGRGVRRGPYEGIK